MSVEEVIYLANGNGSNTKPYGASVMKKKKYFIFMTTLYWQSERKYGR